jgi:hypothetical protein
MTKYSPELFLQATWPGAFPQQRVQPRPDTTLRIRFKEEVLEVGLPRVRDVLQWLKGAATIVIGGSLLGVSISCMGRLVIK